VKPRTAGFIQGFVTAPVLAGAIYLGVEAWPDRAGDSHRVSESGVAAAFDQAVGRAASVRVCHASTATTFVCRAETSYRALAYRVSVSDEGRCWHARATDASWRKQLRAPDAHTPGSVDSSYNGWLHDRADCDPAFKHAQEIKAKEAKAKAARCTPGYSVCIPPDVGDVDCGELGATDIRVTGNDPYGLDADGDGVGCES
jgi:hypothetical protein